MSHTINNVLSLAAQSVVGPGASLAATDSLNFTIIAYATGSGTATIFPSMQMLDGSWQPLKAAFGVIGGSPPTIDQSVKGPLGPVRLELASLAAGMSVSGEILAT